MFKTVECLEVSSNLSSSYPLPPSTPLGVWTPHHHHENSDIEHPQHQPGIASHIIFTITIAYIQIVYQKTSSWLASQRAKKGNPRDDVSACLLEEAEATTPEFSLRQQNHAPYSSKQYTTNEHQASLISAALLRAEHRSVTPSRTRLTVRVTRSEVR